MNMKYTESPKMTTLMRTKFILLTITFTLCSVAQAVEFGTYQPIYQTSSTLGGYGSNYNASGYGSYGTSYSGYRSSSAISAPGAMYAPSLSSPFSTGRLGNSVYRSADENLAIALQPHPSNRVGRRRMPVITGEEEEGETQTDGDGTWTWNGTTWVLEGAPSIGDTKIEGGQVYRWNGSGWELLDDQNAPDQPVGSIPWLMMALLVGVYAYRHKKEVI